MGAAAKGVFGPVAVMTENLKAGRIAMAFQPEVKHTGRIIKKDLPMFRSSPRNMVNGQENGICLAATHTLATICCENCNSPLPPPETSLDTIVFPAHAGPDTELAPRGKAAMFITIKGIQARCNAALATTSPPGRRGNLQTWSRFVTALSLNMPTPMALSAIARSLWIAKIFIGQELFTVRAPSLPARCFTRCCRFWHTNIMAHY